MKSKRPTKQGKSQQDSRALKAREWFSKGVQYINAGELPSAISAFGQAESIFRALIDERQLQFCREWAHTRMNAGNALSRLNRHEEALEHYEEAARVYQTLIAKGQNQLRPDWARNRMNAGVTLNNLYRPEEALKHFLQAIGQPQCRPELAHTRMNMGIALNNLNRPEEALKHYREAAKGYQALIATGQPQLRPNWARTRMNMGNALGNLNRAEEALKCYEEAAREYQTLIDEGQPQCRPEWAHTRMNMGNALGNLNRAEEALKHYQQAAEVFQALIDEGQTQFRPELAHTWMNAGNHINRAEEKLEHYREAADEYQALIAKGQNQFRLNLYLTLVNILEVQGRTEDAETVAHTCDHILDIWGCDDPIPVAWINFGPDLAALIGRNSLTAGFAARAERLAVQLIRALGGISPQHLGQFYPLAEEAFMHLLTTAIDREMWDLALTLVGTANAQRLVKLAQADLLHRAAQTDAPAELREYHEVYRRFAVLEILLNVRTGSSDARFTGGRSLDSTSGQPHAALYAEYTAVRRQLDHLEQTLQQQGLLPSLGTDLFDGAALRERLSPDEAVVILVWHGGGDEEQMPTDVLLLTRNSGQVLTIEALNNLSGQIDSIRKGLKREGRGLREGPQLEKAVQNPVMESAADLGSVDAQTQALTQALTRDFWEPVSRALDIIGKTKPKRRLWNFWKSSDENLADKIAKVWLIPTGQLHGLPWQASAPPGLRCRVVPAPWFMQQALSRQESPAPAIPTAENPLGILAYDAPTAVERKHGRQEKELFHLALEQTLIRAVWGEAVHPLIELEASHPPATFVALAGHGQSDADIPGAARVWVGLQDDGERRYVGFGDLWRTPLKLQSIYLSSCVVGMTREVNGEPMGLLSAGLLRGARYLVGWTMPVDDLGVALFSLLYHWAWREHQDPETALSVARQAFLSGDWPEAALVLARQHLGTHIKGIMNRYHESLPPRLREKDLKENHLFEALKDLARLITDSAEPFWQTLHQGILNEEELQTQANSLADELLARRHRFPFRYVGWFALGCG